jgi:glycerol kinase
MQLQADISGREVRRATARDLSAIGAAHLAGLGAGLWTLGDLESLPRKHEPFTGEWDDGHRARWLAAWHDTVMLSRSRAAGSAALAGPASAATSNCSHSPA